MSSASLRARYLGDSVATSSPQQVLVMLYDLLALDLERAQKAVAAGEREAASEQLQHAQAIVLELLSSLQVDAWEGGPRLASLYNWLIGELVLQQPGGTLAEVGRDLAQAGRRHPVVGASSPGGDLVGTTTRHGLLGGENLALEVVQDNRPVDRGRLLVAALERATVVHDGVPASEAAACRHASRSGSTTCRQAEMRLVSSLMLAWTSSPISQL